MRTLKYLITAAMAAALAFASCTKELEVPDEPGQEEESSSRDTGVPVVFGVSTGYDNEPETKVEYSGVTTDGYERINWELDDRLEILCHEALGPNKKAEYKITRLPSNTGKESKAPIDKAGATGLLWGTGIEHKFYGVYPKSTGAGNSLKNKVISTTDIPSFTIKAEVPSIQGPGNEPIMTALANVKRNENTPIALNFTPAVNTFDLEITNTLSTTLSLQSIELYSPLTKISGPYEIGYLETKRQYHFNKNRSLQKKSVKYVYERPRIFAPGDSVHVRLYTLPKDINHLTLVLNFQEGSTNFEFKFRRRNTYLWRIFYSEKKYNLKDIRVQRVMHPVSEYIFDVDRPDTLIFAPFSLTYPAVSSAEPLSREVKVKSFGIFPTVTNEPLPVAWGYGSDYHWANYKNIRNYYSGGNL